MNLMTSIHLETELEKTARLRAEKSVKDLKLWHWQDTYLPKRIDEARKRAGKFRYIMLFLLRP